MFRSCTRSHKTDHVFADAKRYSLASCHTEDQASTGIMTLDNLTYTCRVVEENENLGCYRNRVSKSFPSYEEDVAHRYSSPSKTDVLLI
jgi:hypothetical protein